MFFYKITNELTKPALLHMAKISGIKRYSALNKGKLIDILQTHFCALYCARLYLRRINKTKVYINTTDPITQCDVKHPYFELEITNGKYVKYNMSSFYSYMIKTGNFKDPFTDIQFTDSQLNILDKQLKKNGFMKQSLYDIKNNPNKINYYKRLEERENCLLGMDRQIGDLLTEMCDDLVDKLHSGDNVEHTCYHTLSHTFLPNLIYLLEQLKQIDVQYTRNCLCDYISWVKNQNVPLGNIITNMLKKELHHLS